jgi:PAS domain S-box-containing protein
MKPGMGLPSSPFWAEPLLRGQGQLLERLAAGASLSEILEDLCLLVETHCPGKKCAVLLVEGGDHFRIGGAPTLPDLFRSGVDGSGLGPGTTPCGLAASLRCEVSVEDIQTNPDWIQAAPLAQALALHGVVSIPILGGPEQVLGTFALYQGAPGPFPSAELELLRACVGLASIAIRHHQREDQDLRASEARLRAEDRYRKLVDSLAEGIAIVGFDEVFEFANPAAHADFGVDPGTLPGRRLTEFLEPDQLKILHDQALRRLDGQQSRYELKIHRPNGEIRILAVNAVPRIREDGSFGGAFVVFLDITERVEGEAALRRTEYRFRRLFEAIPVGVVIHREGRIQYVNPATLKAAGLTASEEMVGRAITDFLSPEDLRITQERLKILMAGGEVPWIEMHHLRADGTPFPVESRMMRLEGDEKPVLLSVFQDITERKRSDEALRQAQKLESLGVLAGGIAHDFNNLLTAMLGNLNLAQIAIPEENPSNTYLEQLERAIVKASDLTRQMLAYSGRGRFIVRAVNLNRVVEEMADLLSVSISKMVALQFRLHQDLPSVEADGTQLQQVVMNLVLNASEAIGDKQGTIALSTRPVVLTEADLARDFPGQAMKAGDHVLLEVQDTGTGMTSEVAQRIFDPFFTTKATGRGLGLSAMQGILRGHHAGIRVTTAPGKGTTFSIYFQPSETPPSEAGGPAPASQASPSRGRILVVDDEEAVRLTLGAMLRSLGFEVLEAEDGVQALELFQREGGSLAGMLLDLSMPRLDGRETLKVLRATAPRFPVLLNSGYDDGAALQPLLDLGPAVFLQKPYSLETLREALAKLLSR